MVVYGPPAAARVHFNLIARERERRVDTWCSLSMYGCPTMRVPLAVAPSRRASHVPGFVGWGGTGGEEPQVPPCTAAVETVRWSPTRAAQSHAHWTANPTTRWTTAV